MTFDSELLLKQLGVDLVKEADDLEQVDEGTDKFKIFARDHVKSADGTWPGAILTASVSPGADGEEEFILQGLASSTIKDRHGDVMLPTALIDMERDANNGLTMFLNHSYEVPEDLAGSVKSAKIDSFGVEQETGAPIYDLNYVFRVDKTNPRALQSFKSQRAGTKLGLSIGARIPEGGAIRNKKTGKLLIAHVELLETSIVGVPANPRSWVEQAKKSVDEAIEKAHVFALGELKVASLDAPVVEVTVTPEPVVKADEPEPDNFDYTKGDGPEVQRELKQSTTPSQDAPESTPEPDVTAAADDPEAATPSVNLPDLEKADAPDLIAALVLAQASVSELTLNLIEASKGLQKAEQRAQDAERERDTTVRIAKDLAADTAQIIKRIAALPAGQKASFKRIQADFTDGLDSATEVLGDDFIATLRSFKE